MVGMFGPDAGEPQTGDGGAGRRAVRCSGASTPSQPLRRFAHARDHIDARARSRRGAARPDGRATRPRVRGGGAEAPSRAAARTARAAGDGSARPPGRALDRRRGRRVAGYTLVDLSRRLDAVHLRRAADARRRSRCPTATAASSSGWPTTSWTRTASRCEPGAKNYLELYGIFPSLSVLRARFVQRRTAPLPRSGERRRARGGRDRHLRRRPPTSRRTSGAWRRIARRAGDGAAQGARSRRWRSWRSSSRRWRPRSKLIARRAAEKPAMAAVEQRLTCEGLLGAGRASTPPGIYDDADAPGGPAASSRST